MSFLDSLSSTLGSIVQGVSDEATMGQMGSIVRAQLNDARNQLSAAIADYQKLYGKVGAWRDPVNQIGGYTAAMVRQASDYAHGIAVNYQTIIENASLNVPAIRDLAAKNVVKPLIDLPIPGDFGGIPSVLIPGVESLRIVTGLINVVGDSLTLPFQLRDTRQQLAQASSYVQQEAEVLQNLISVQQYLLQIANNVVEVFRRVTDLQLPTFAADTPDALKQVASAMQVTIDQITAVKNNAFVVSRFIVNVVQSKKLQTVNPTQTAFIVDALFEVDDIREAFATKSALQQFLVNFFDGQLVVPPILLSFPPPPPAIVPYIDETAPTHQTYSDPNAAQFDPPPIDLSHFPT